MDQSKIPEAVASVTYSVVTPKGFPVLLTIRAETDVELLERMGGLEDMFLDEGYKPDSRKSTFVTNKYQPKATQSNPATDKATDDQKRIIMKHDPDKWDDKLTREQALEIIKGLM